MQCELAHRPSQQFCCRLFAVVRVLYATLALVSGYWNGGSSGKNAVFPRMFCESRDCRGKYHPAGSRKFLYLQSKTVPQSSAMMGYNQTISDTSAGVIYWHDEVIRRTIEGIQYRTLIESGDLKQRCLPIDRHPVNKVEKFTTLVDVTPRIILVFEN
ncbi:hypothetical protein RvY_10770 [Ramazzottius varieornatus]|uniref:Uncharacterized protein n=1 Tax=Ramazzottius varieornatus TaxID=947166 RepID=A0A1D1VMV0_RAMVA|nr:hypothetical protein RvY_10770 [Ramazzottius varieornatus]